jgi:hypothetical protein
MPKHATPSARIRALRKAFAASVITLGVGACTVFDTSHLTGNSAVVATPLQDAGLSRADQNNETTLVDASEPRETSVADSSNPVGDAAPQSYCDGWALCDTFDGDRSIATWQVVANGPGASIAKSSVRAQSGTQSLRAQRSAGNTDYALWKIDGVLNECEFDTYVVDTFAGSAPELQVAFFGINAAGFYLVEPLEAIFRNDGFFGHWFAEQPLGTGVGSGSTATFPLQPTRTSER